VGVVDRSLVGAEQPPFGQRGDLVHAGQQLGRVRPRRAGERLVDIQLGGRRPVRPSVITRAPDSTLSVRNARSESAEASASGAMRQRPNPFGWVRSTAIPTSTFLPFWRPPRSPGSSPPK
jgi:hypothetical protein